MRFLLLLLLSSAAYAQDCFVEIRDGTRYVTCVERPVHNKPEYRAPDRGYDHGRRSAAEAAAAEYYKPYGGYQPGKQLHIGKGSHSWYTTEEVKR